MDAEMNFSRFTPYWNVTIETPWLPPEIPSNIHAAVLAFKVAVTVLCILLNTVGLAVIIYGKLYLKTMFYILMILTCNDLLMGVTHLHLSLYAGEVGPRIEGTAACTLLALSIRFFNANSLLGLTIYNADRFLAIWKPYLYLRWVNKTRISAVWCGILLITTTTIASLVFTAPEIIYSHTNEICVDVSKQGPIIARLRYLYDIIFSTVCFAIILLSSYKVSTIVRSHKEKMRAQDLVSGSGIHREDASRLAAFRSVMYMSVVFFLTGLPRFVVFFSLRGHLPPGLPVTIIWLVHTNSFLNILIFGFSYTEFSSSLTKLMRRCKQLFTKTDNPTITIEYINCESARVSLSINNTHCDETVTQEPKELI